MHRPTPLARTAPARSPATLVCLAAALPTALTPISALAHAVAGARIFVPTLTMDDPGVADEASLPTIQYQRSGANGGPGPTHEVDLGFEYDKRLTEFFGFAINDGWNIFQTDHAKTQTGFPNLTITAKYTFYINAEHEFIASIGVQREFGGTATLHTGGDKYGATAPTLYAGKGLGDLPIGLARGLALTGELSYAITDVKVKGSTVADPDTGATSVSYNLGSNNQWSGGISLQYSFPYLKAQVKDFGLPAFFNHLIPALEITWSSPSGSVTAGASGGAGTQLMYAPGVFYLADTWDIGIEALIPGNKATGTNVGAIAQFHLFLDDIFPHSLGKPIFDGADAR